MGEYVFRMARAGLKRRFPARAVVNSTSHGARLYWFKDAFHITTPQVGLGRIVALYHRPFTSYQIH